MILSLYIARRFLATTGQVFMVFFGILLLIDMIEQMRRLSGAGVGLPQAFHLSLLNVPETLYTILPLIFVMGAIALFLALARSSELVVVRAAGRSGLRFLATPVFVTLIIGLITITILNPFVAATSRAYADLRASYTDAQAVLSLDDSGLWLRQGGEYGQTVIQAARANADGTTLYNASFMTFGIDGIPQGRVNAAQAQLTPGGWQLTEAKLWELSGSNPEQSSRMLENGTILPSDLTPERIRDSFGTPSAVPLWQLPSYIAGLERAGFAATSYRLWFQMELAQPLLLMAMVLVAAGFTMRHARFGNTGLRVLYAILCGFALFFLRNFAQALGETGQIPVLLAAWTPPLAAVMLALSLLLHLEDG